MTYELLIFGLGSLTGLLGSAFVFSVSFSRKAEEMHDELVSTRETIRRNAYARGYEAAKSGGLKRS